MSNQPWHDINWDMLKHVNNMTPAEIIETLDLIHAPDTPARTISARIDRLISPQYGITVTRADTLPHLFRFTMPLLHRSDASIVMSVIRAISTIALHMSKLRQISPVDLTVLQNMQACFALIHAHLDLIIMHIQTVDLKRFRHADIHRLFMCLVDDAPEVVQKLIEAMPNITSARMRLTLVNSIQSLCEDYLNVVWNTHAKSDLHRAQLREMRAMTRWFATILLDKEKDTAMREAIVQLALTVAEPPLNEVVFHALEASLRRRPRRHVPLMHHHSKFTTQQLIRLLNHKSFDTRRVHRYVMELATGLGVLNMEPRFIEKGGRISTEFANSRRDGFNRDRFIMVVAACDAFWALPSDMLSRYFYLPDDRDALFHQLAEREIEQREREAREQHRRNAYKR